MDELRIPPRFNMDGKKKLQSRVLDMKLQHSVPAYILWKELSHFSIFKIKMRELDHSVPSFIKCRSLLLWLNNIPISKGSVS